MAGAIRCNNMEGSEEVFVKGLCLWRAACWQLDGGRPGNGQTMEDDRCRRAPAGVFVFGIILDFHPYVNDHISPWARDKWKRLRSHRLQVGRLSERWNRVLWRWPTWARVRGAKSPMHNVTFCIPFGSVIRPRCWLPCPRCWKGAGDEGRVDSPRRLLAHAIVITTSYAMWP